MTLNRMGRRHHKGLPLWVWLLLYCIGMAGGMKAIHDDAQTQKEEQRE